jgi:predicted anti-sigma-YlaC factor YlaD
MNTNHPSKEVLSRYYDGEIKSTRQHQQVAEHVATCDTCQKYLQKLECLSSTIKAPAQLQMEHATLSEVLPKKRYKTKSFRILAVAALFFVIVGLGFFVNSLGKSGSSETNSEWALDWVVTLLFETFFIPENAIYLVLGPDTASE